MGEVYLVEHPRLPRQDALKILRADVSTDEEFRRRFVREADSVAAMSHPNIVAVYDRGEFDGQLWIAAQYVDGTDAAQLVRERYPAGLPVEEAVTVASAIADALDYAHEQGVLHRDVKPANILLSQPGRDGARRIFLADFGIARPLADPSGITATNFSVGTVAYAAPEQLIGGDIDGGADQYALAATMFHLLTGRPPYEDSNPVAVISKHLSTPPAQLSSFRHDLVDLDLVFTRGLAKEPAKRYESCVDFARDLSQYAALTQQEPNAITQTAVPAPRSMVQAAEAETLAAPRPLRPARTPSRTSAPPPRTHNATNSKQRNRRILIAVMAAISALAISVPLLLGLLTPQLSRQSEAPTTPTTTAPPLTIKPLSVRPVVSAFVTTPDQCPPPTPAPPDAPMRICDIAKTAVYELQPEAMRVQLTNVDSFRNPLTGAELVQMSMTDESAQQFGQFTAGQVGKQVAFVRAGTVVWGPKISAPIDGQVLQLSGELTPEQAKEIARMLRDET
jgi:serine/threonine-protein kinase